MSFTAHHAAIASPASPAGAAGAAGAAGSPSPHEASRGIVAIVAGIVASHSRKVAVIVAIVAGQESALIVAESLR